MNETKVTAKILLAIACCLVIVLAPLAASAQGDILKKGAEGVKKGAETVGKGAETVGEKAVEGTKAVGEEVAKPFTDDDKDKNTTDTQRMKSTEPSQTTTPSTTTKPPSKTTTRSKSTTAPGETTTTGETEKENKKLPSTAGELPLLALAGVLALAAAGAVRVVRREQ